MKINSFSAKSVYGYLRFDIDFMRSPTIFTGPNGSGKTTALRMMQALVTPSLRDLLLIQFSEAHIQVSDTGGIRVITARKGRDKLTLSISTEASSLEIPLSLMQSIEPELGDPRRVAESARMMKMKYSDNATFRAISELQSPVFLGLDRRNIGFQDDHSANPFSEESGSREFGHRLVGGKLVRGSLAAGLVETQALVRDAFRRVRHVKDQQSERLRKKMLLNGFKYSEVSHVNVFDQLKVDTQLMSVAGLEQQRAALVRGLISIGIDESDSRKELDPFFERVIQLATRLKHAHQRADSEAMLEALINQSNLQRLRDLVDTVREFNTKSDQLSSRFESFVACINRFLSDSRKSIEIDPVGQIRVHRPDGNEVPLEALSSGERQLLVMFGHIYFNSFGHRSNVFVIDEPELSLHLRWQEVLLQEMLDSSSRAQFVIATHSPEIVGEFVDCCVSI